MIAGVIWLVTGSAEAGGAAIFFLVVTGAMLPVVFITWQRQTTPCSSTQRVSPRCIPGLSSRP